MQLDTASILIDFLKFSINLWELWIVIGSLLFLGLTIKIFQLVKLSKTGIFEIDKMTGIEFEDRLEILFRRMGYTVDHTGRNTGDYGVDLVIEKDGIKTAVQAKRHKSLIGEDAVREVFSGMAMYKCTKALVVTNSNYSYQAKKLASINGVELWNRNKLIKLLSNEKLTTKRI